MISVLDCKIIAKPNNSLSEDGLVKLFLVMMLVALVIALGFVSKGAWLVLPFAGLELLAFAWAFYHVSLHSRDFESITIDADQVLVEKFSKSDTSSSVFHRYWTRVSLKTNTDGRMALCIGSHGKEVEFARYLINDEQRVVLMRELKEKLKYTN
jgi:uncharacterized membrane protein